MSSKDTAVNNITDVSCAIIHRMTGHPTQTWIVGGGEEKVRVRDTLCSGNRLWRMNSLDLTVPNSAQACIDQSVEMRNRGNIGLDE